MSYFKAKMHQIRLRLGLRPRHHWGSLQRSPRPLAGFKGPTSKGRGWDGTGGEDKGGQGAGRETGREGREREKRSEGIGEGEGGEGELGSPTHYFRLK